MKKNILVLGAGGFIGSHLVKRLKNEGCWVRGVDLKHPEFTNSSADEFIIGDLRDQKLVKSIFDQKFDEVYQLAADMGGAAFIFTGDNDAEIMYNSALINLNIANICHKVGVGTLFYSSSACMYPAYNQEDPQNPKCSEDSAYPAAPDSEYGWEKLFSERLYLAYNRNFGLNVRIARYHNIFGPESTWHGGREKAPSAISRKVAECKDGGQIEIWGTGKQTRSFLYIEECLDATIKLTRSNFIGPVNIGSEEMITIENLTKMVIKLSGKNIDINYVQGPIGVMGRNSDNKLIKEKLSWNPKTDLLYGMKILYQWVDTQVQAGPSQQRI